VLVYLDSNIVIYLIEQPAHFGPRASVHIASLLTAGSRIVDSQLTRMECRSNPLAAGDHRILARYDAFFIGAVARVMSLTMAVIDRATAIRGQFRFKTPDALHLSAAVEAGCQVFLTNDLRLNKFPDLTVETLP
jgi:uncharacterized protein